MDDSFISVMVFFVFGVLAIFAMYVSYRINQARKEALFLLAQRLGMTFEPLDTQSIPDLYDYFDCLSRGDSREASNLLIGKIDSFDLRAFDYKYCTGSGKSRQTHKLGVVVVDTDVCFHSLLIRSEGFFDRVAGAFGFDDIDFESDEFSRRFYVGSPDKQYAYEMIHPMMMEFLLKNPQWSIQTFGRTVLITNHRILGPEEFDQAFAFLRDFLRMIPDFVWRKLREGR